MNEPTRRQLTALGFVALLSPATRLLPGAAARLGGHAGWLGSVLAAPLCVLAALLVSRAVKNKRPGEGLGQLLLRALPRLSRPVLLIYGLWLAFYAGFAVRSAASRFIYTIYTGSSPWPFAAVGLAAGTLAALGSVRQLARAAEIFRALLMLTLAPILALGLAQLDWGELLPLRGADLPQLAAFALEVFGTVAFALVNVTFLETGAPLERRARAAAGWSLRECLFICVVIASVLGRFGPELAGEMAYPFFALVRNTSLFGVSQRIEALVTALWVLSDFVLCALALMSASLCLRLALGAKRGARPRAAVTAACALLALGSALVLAPDSLTLRWVSEVLVVRLNLAMLCLMLPLLALAGGRLKT